MSFKERERMRPSRLYQCFIVLVLILGFFMLSNKIGSDTRKDAFTVE